MTLRSAVLLALLVPLVVAAPAAAKVKTVKWLQPVDVGHRFSDQLGFIPLNEILAVKNGRPVPMRYVQGTTTYRIVVFSGSVLNCDTTRNLKESRADAKYGFVQKGTYTDRALTTAEKRHFKVLVDLARDADVLVVHAENPVCASGLTQAQARGIANGTITRWSQVTTLPAGQPDTINRRLYGRPANPEGIAVVQPRLGLKFARVTGAVAQLVRSDGGIAESRRDRSVAAMTSWSRIRRDGSLCSVPIDGVRPTNASVHGLRYPEAYPIQYVMHRNPTRNPERRAIVGAYVKWLKSARARASFGRTGVLMVAEPPPAMPAPVGPPPGSSPTTAPSGGPGQDHAGRPITTTRDDAGVRSSLTGARVERNTSGAIERLAFDPDRVLVSITSFEGQDCRRGDGTWDLTEGYRYPENGGGLIARVTQAFAGTSKVITIEIPSDGSGSAYVNGQAYRSDPGLSNSCF